MMETSIDIRTLNGLIATTLDSIDGYTTAAEDSQSGRFRQMFLDRASERRTVVESLRAEVGRQGGNPEDDGTLLAGAHRAFLNLKATVTGQDDESIVAEVERGEDHIKAKYERALEDGSLDSATCTVISEAYRSVKQGHDQMRDLKHALEGNA